MKGPEQSSQAASSEKKEKPKTKETLGLALKELEVIVERLPENSREKARAQHTLSSVRFALENLDKHGASKGKYPVAVEGYPGNPQESYVQHEGVPVDELINILASSAKEVDKNFPTKESLLELKKKVKDLSEEYTLEVERVEKAIKYSKWEDARKAYRKMEELFDNGRSQDGKKLDELASDLFKKSQSYWEVHYTKAHGEGADVWTDEERNRQDLRTRHEAKLISLDYRATGSEEGDYQAAMDVLKHRRELNLADDEKDMLDKEEPKPIPEPEEPKTPEEPKIPEEKQPKKPEKVTVVEAQALVDFLARKQGIKLLNEKLNQGGRMKRWWTRMWEPAYREMLIAEEKKRILGKENKPGWLRRKLFGAKEIAATGVKNLFAGTGNEAESQKELESLLERFQEDYIRHAEGEQKQQLTDPALSKGINDLIFEYASGTMTDADFRARKEAFMETVAKTYPDVVARDGLTVDNFLEAAKNFRKIHLHNQGLARTDVQLEIDLGAAKQAIKTKVNLTWIDKAVNWSQKHGGPALSPEALGIATSIGGYFSRKPLYWLGGAAGLGGILGAMRKNVEQKHDLEMHRVERASGDEIADFGPDAERRQRAEKFVGKMEKASDVTYTIQTLFVSYSATPDKGTADALISALAETEARLSLSTERERDLISFSGETVLERGRLDLLRASAEAKVALKNGGFLADGDITKTDKYTDFVKALGADMDKIDQSESRQRWSENIKAGVVGAVGGAVVGGLVQEGLALVGDHVPFLHWLRPGGKLTGIERLYHYLNGELPTGPTGAGVEQMFSTPGGHGILSLDGSTNVVRDPSTGLWNLIDKSDPGKILAQFNMDPVTGRTIPVPGSYDPNLIHFSEVPTTYTAGGGPKSFDDWMALVKGKLGTNVVSEEWHLGGAGFLENDTALPKTEFNELRLFTSYDAAGHVNVDASKLREYLTDVVSGHQIEGSSHSGKILEVAKAFADGKIHIGLVPDASKPTEVLRLTIDPVTKAFTTENGSSIDQFFMPDPKTGLPVLKGDSLLGTVHEVGIRPDGSRNIEWINAIRGNGEPINTGETETTVTEFSTEINRRVPKEWWGLWAWNFRRKPLEEKGGNGDKYIPYGGKDGKQPPYEYFEMPEDEEKKIKDKKITGVAHDTRGQLRDDRKDYVEGYPEKFKFLNEDEMAEVLDSGNGIVTSPEYIFDLRKLDATGRKKFLADAIRKEQGNLRVGELLFDKKLIDAVIDAVYKQTNKVLDKYSGGEGGRNLLPSKDKIHVVGGLEYQAQARAAGKNSLGSNFMSSGEIFVNFDALKFRISDPNMFMMQLKRTIAHEVVHGAAVNNYWMFQMEGDVSETAIPRRFGLGFIRRENAEKGRGFKKKGVHEMIQERGRALNEAITESLAEEVTREIYVSENIPQPIPNMEPYSEERDIMKLLQEKFGLTRDDFAKAAINRRALRPLVQKLEGLTTAEGGARERLRPEFMPLLLSIMDYEHNGRAFDYRVTRQLIDGKKDIVITKQMKRNFPNNLLDREGNIKPELVERYLLIDEEVAEKQRKAA